MRCASGIWIGWRVAEVDGVERMGEVRTEDAKNDEQTEMVSIGLERTWAHGIKLMN